MRLEKNQLLPLLLLLFLRQPALASIKVGDPAPPILLDRMLAGPSASEVDLKLLHGKVVVLEFWATWCGPCVASIPHFNELVDAFAGRPVEFLSLTDEERTVVEKFLKWRPIRGGIGIDRAGATAKAYGIEGIPATVIVDASGKVAGITSPQSLSVEHIQAVLSGQTPSLPPRDTALVLPSLRTGESVPVATVDLVIRPSSAKGDAMVVETGKFQASWLTLHDLFASAYDLPKHRILGAVVDDTTRYDVSFALPGVPEEEIAGLLPNLLCTAFRLSATRKRHEEQVWVLKTGRDKSKLPRPAANSASELQCGNGAFHMIGTSTLQMADAIERLIGAPVVDETGLKGAYDVDLTYDNAHPTSILDAIRTHGFEVQSGLRMIDVVVLNKRE